MLTQNISSIDKVYNVILVEDSSSYRFLLTKFLKDQGKLNTFPKYNIHSFGTPQECMNNLDSIKPELVVLDYNLDETNSEENEIENGFDLMVAIKTRYPATRVLFLSEQENVHVTAQIFHNGADGYIPKNPFGRVQIYNFISKILSEVSIEESKEEYNKSKVFRSHAFSLKPM